MVGSCEAAAWGLSAVGVEFRGAGLRFGALGSPAQGSGQGLLTARIFKDLWFRV